MAELVHLDDHVGIASTRSRQAAPARYLDDSFKRATNGYSIIGWHLHPTKSRRLCLDGLALGREVLGGVGTVGAERIRRMKLSATSCLLARARRSTPHLWARVTATWNFVGLVPRPLLSILSATYRCSNKDVTENEMVSVLPSVADEWIIC